MKPDRLAGIFLLLATVLMPGCGGLTQRASAGMAPMVEALPFRAERPVARELRYTYMSLIVLDGKEHKRIVAADDVTRTGGAMAPRAVFVSAMAPARRVSDDITRQARELEKRGADRKIVASLHGQAAAAGATENAMERAQAGVALMSAYMNFLASLEHAGQWLTDGYAARLGDWVRRHTGTVGPSAPEGSVLQVDFLFVNSGKAYGVDSKSDFLVQATLFRPTSRSVAGRAGFELYTYSGTSTIEIPADAIPVQPGYLTPPQRGVLSDVIADPFSVQLAIAANAALTDLYRQLGAR